MMRDMEDSAHMSTPLADDELAALVAEADRVVGQVLDWDPRDAGARRQGRSLVEVMGRDPQRIAARRSAFLEMPLRSLSGRGGDGGPIATALVALKREVDALDPARFNLSPEGVGRWLGWLPFVGSPIKRYFARYESSSGTITTIVDELVQARESLRRDTITLQADQAQLSESVRELAAAVELGRMIDTRLERAIDTLPVGDARRGFVLEDIVFPLRQRVQDLQQQLLVSQQGVMASELVVRSNRELMRGVDRATQVTVSALQTAAALALALANQKIVLEKIDAVTQTTNALIAGNASRLRHQGVDIQRRAASTQLDIDTLRQAFVDIRSALDDVARFRASALPRMTADIERMQVLVEQSQDAIARIEQGGKPHDLIENRSA